jgi:hypothetical protein
MRRGRAGPDSRASEDRVGLIEERAMSEGLLLALLGQHAMVPARFLALVRI